MVKRLLLTATTITSYVGVAVLMFRVWSNAAIGQTMTPQPIILTSVMCPLTTGIMATLQRGGYRSTIAWGIAGLLLGFLLFPSTSISPSKYNSTVFNGSIRLFKPYALCIGACLGTLIGQNLPDFRKVLASINRVSQWS